jgi:S1-C subfamily serine protease
MLMLLGITSCDALLGKHKKAEQKTESTTPDAPCVHEWERAQKIAKNTVVQVLVQSAKFNWADPYCAPIQQQFCGSGFFIDAQGHMLTNHHVVEGAKTAQIRVPVFGQDLLDVAILGVYPELDLALLKLTDEAVNKLRKELGSIPFLTLGDSEKLKPAEPVLALGYPLGLRYIKSTVGVLGGREYLHGTSFLHITAPINPGNSGGPLLNREGEVVGINSAGLDTTARLGVGPENAMVLQNIGYIIPINYVKNVLRDLYTRKVLRKPTLGLIANPTTAEHAQLLGNPVPTGVYVNKVQKHSLAEKAGIKEGDMLYKINGFTIDNYGDVLVNWQSARKVTLEEFLLHVPIRSKLTLTVYRKGVRRELSCTFEATEPQPIRVIYPDFEPQETAYEMLAGLCIMQLRANHFNSLPRTPILHDYAQPDNADKQVLVITRVAPGSYVHKIHCLQEGDVIKTINGKEVKTLTDLRKALEQSKATGRIIITTQENIETVISTAKIAAEEARLARDFMFAPVQNMQAGTQQVPTTATVRIPHKTAHNQ